MIAVSRSRRLNQVGPIALVGLVVLACTARVARADTLLVLPTSGENVSTPIVQEAHYHLVSWLTILARGRYQVVAPQGPAAAKPLEPARAIEMAVAAAAEMVVTLHIAHDPQTTMLILTGYPVRSSAPPVQILERLTAGPEFLPGMIHDMAFAFLSRSAPPFSDPGMPDDVTPKRPPRDIFVGLAMGSVTAFNTADRVTKWLPSGAIFVMRVMPTALADFRGEYASQGSAHVASLAAGFYWLPAGQGVYVGAAMKWSWLNLGGTGDRGFAAQPTAGYLYRLGKAALLRAEVGYVANLFAEVGPDRLIPGSGQAHYAHGPVTSLGVAF
jgi:hypothetical protein